MIQDRYNNLLRIIKRYKQASVAFSGGVDSSLVAKAAYDALGKNAVAVTISSEFTAKRDLEFARVSAQDIGIQHKIIKLKLLTDAKIVLNDELRCYHCKKAIIIGINAPCIMEGSHKDDPKYRPGLKALQEAGVISPLALARFDKQMILDAARQLNLKAADRPSNSCLATRIKTGNSLTGTMLRYIELVEDVMFESGATWCRARPNQHSFKIEYGSESKLCEDSIKIRLNTLLGSKWNISFYPQ